LSFAINVRHVPYTSSTPWRAWARFVAHHLRYRLEEGNISFSVISSRVYTFVFPTNIQAENAYDSLPEFKTP